MLSEWLADPACARNAHVRLVAGLIHAAEGNDAEALRALNGGAAGAAAERSLEALALSVQVLLRMDRADKAEAVVKEMSAIDDDATVTQLATAWAGAQLGGAKVQEAAYIYQELGDKFAWTVRPAGLLDCCWLVAGGGGCGGTGGPCCRLKEGTGAGHHEQHSKIRNTSANSKHLRHHYTTTPHTPPPTHTHSPSSTPASPSAA